MVAARAIEVAEQNAKSKLLAIHSQSECYDLSSNHFMGDEGRGLRRSHFNPYLCISVITHISTLLDQDLFQIPESLIHGSEPNLLFLSNPCIYFGGKALLFLTGVEGRVDQKGVLIVSLEKASRRLGSPGEECIGS